MLILMFDFFFVYGIINLIILTAQDIKKNNLKKPRMRVDSRLNYIMMGVVFAILAMIRPPIYFIFLIFIIILLLTIFASKFLAKGDIEAVTWILMGTLILNSLLLIYFLIAFIILLVIYSFIKKYAGDNTSTKRIPGMPFILISFIIISLLNFII